jgi:hypothetical protein
MRRMAAVGTHQDAGDHSIHGGMIGAGIAKVNCIFKIN